MSSLRKGHWIIISSTAVLVVVLLIMPTQSTVPHPKPAPQSSDLPPDTEYRIDSALRLINGEEPMQGILLLRQVAEEFPDNFRAQYHLGQFSMQTGQWEKAKKRFLAAKALDPENGELYFLIGKCEFELGNMKEAKLELETYINEESSAAVFREEADSILTLIKE